MKEVIPIVKSIKTFQYSNIYKVDLQFEFDNGIIHKFELDLGMTRKELCKKLNDITICFNADSSLDRKKIYELTNNI